MNNVRILWCVCYLILGLAALITFGIRECPKLSKLLENNASYILWCTGWAAVGIALGLWNSRNDGSILHLHYITYFVFVWFIASTAGVAATSIGHGLQSYAASAVVAVAIGLAGDSLAGFILNLVGK